LTADEPEYFYDLLDELKVKSFRFKAEIPISGYDEVKKIKEKHTGRLKPAPIYDDPEKAPERFGLMADELPDFLSSKDKKGLNANRIAAFVLTIVQHQKKLIADMRIEIDDLKIRVEALESN